MRDLVVKAGEIREKLALATRRIGNVHIGGPMSAADVTTAIYYKYMGFDPDNLDDPNRDRFILSKGHNGILLFTIFCDMGMYDWDLLLDTYNTIGHPFGAHPNHKRVKGIEVSTGSLGHGLPIAVGTGLAARVLGKDYKTYCILGDGECDEGSNWEAAMSAAHFKVDNVISFVDRNKCMIDGRTEDVMSLEPFADKWRAFGFIVKEVDGHNFNELSEAIDFALENKGAPVMIIANTIKGEGIDFMEDNYLWHYGAIDDEKYAKAKESLDKHYAKRVARAEKEGV